MARLAFAVLAIFLICVATLGDAAPLPLNLQIPKPIPQLLTSQGGAALIPLNLTANAAANYLAEAMQGNKASSLLDQMVTSTTAPISTAALISALKLAQNVPEVLWNSGAAIANLETLVKATSPLPDQIQLVEEIPDGLDALYFDLLNGPADVEALAQNVPEVLFVVVTSVGNAVRGSPDAQQSLVQILDEAADILNVDLLKGLAAGEDAQQSLVQILDEAADTISVDLAKGLADDEGGDLTSGPNGVAGIQIQ